MHKNNKYQSLSSLTHSTHSQTHIFLPVIYFPVKLKGPLLAGVQLGKVTVEVLPADLGLTHLADHGAGHAKVVAHHLLRAVIVVSLLFLLLLLWEVVAEAVHQVLHLVLLPIGLLVVDPALK